ncbi:MAG: hypothetical protein SFX18_07665 [Pirellulales bacterium]|nr:hypothetical protein [Pirellulales bacterium]
MPPDNPYESPRVVSLEELSPVSLSDEAPKELVMTPEVAESLKLLSWGLFFCFLSIPCLLIWGIFEYAISLILRPRRAEDYAPLVHLIATQLPRGVGLLMYVPFGRLFSYLRNVYGIMFACITFSFIPCLGVIILDNYLRRNGIITFNLFALLAYVVFVYSYLLETRFYYQVARTLRQRESGLVLFYLTIWFWISLGISLIFVGCEICNLYAPMVAITNVFRTLFGIFLFGNIIAFLFLLVAGLWLKSGVWKILNGLPPTDHSTCNVNQ